MSHSLSIRVENVITGEEQLDTKLRAEDVLSGNMIATELVPCFSSVMDGWKGKDNGNYL